MLLEEDYVTAIKLDTRYKYFTENAEENRRFYKEKEAKIKRNLGSGSSVFFSKCLIFYPLTFILL